MCVKSISVFTRLIAELQTGALGYPEESLEGAESSVTNSISIQLTRYSLP